MTLPRWPWMCLALVVVAAFALRILALIDATALWGDELYSVGKSFQPSLSELWSMLRHDTHPPLYYTVLWGWGQLIGQSPISLRLLSWFAYLAGGGVMVAQSLALADGQRRVVPLALLLAFCSPYPVRFAIEGKGYALLVLLVALAWWWRRAQRPWPEWPPPVRLDPLLWLVCGAGDGHLGCPATAPPVGVGGWDRSVARRGLDHLRL